MYRMSRVAREYFVLSVLRTEANRLRAAMRREINGEVEHRMIAGRALPRRVRVARTRVKETFRQAFMRRVGGAGRRGRAPPIASVSCSVIVIPPEGGAGAACSDFASRRYDDPRLVRACVPAADQPLVRAMAGRLAVARRLVEGRRRMDPASDATMDAYRGVLEVLRAVESRIEALSREMCERWGRRPGHRFADGWRVAFRRRNVYDWERHLRRTFHTDQRRTRPRVAIHVR